MQELTIKELKEIKKDLEEELGDAVRGIVRKFYEKTNFEISYIGIDMQNITREDGKVFNLSFKVNIDIDIWS